MANPKYQDYPIGWVPVSNRWPRALTRDQRRAALEVVSNPPQTTRYDFRNGGAFNGNVDTNVLNLRAYSLHRVTLAQPQYGGNVREVALNGRNTNPSGR